MSSSKSLQIIQHAQKPDNLTGILDGTHESKRLRQNTKALLVVPKYNFAKEIFHQYTFPVGMAYVSAALKRAGYQVDCLNLNQNFGEDSKLVKEALNKKKYDFVLTGGNDLVYRTVKRIISTIKSHSTKPISILAGPILTHEPELMTKDMEPDLAIIGEGELTTIQLLDCLIQKEDINKVPGVIYSKNGSIIITEKPKAIKNLEEIPFPDFESFGFEEHLKHQHSNDYFFHNPHDYPKSYPLLGSRGCAFNCTFCWHPENYRTRSVDHIMKEIGEVVKKYKINNLQILDDCFSIKEERVYEFCKKIKELSKEIGYKITWTCQLLVHTVDRQILNTMKDAGCESISYGFESMSPVVLKSMMKPITPEQLDNALHATLDAKIAIKAHLILGDTAETLETAQETLDYWINNCQGQIGLGYVQPYPGSVIYQRCVEKGIIKDRLDYIKNGMDPQNSINMTDNISNKDFKRLRKKVLSAYSKYNKFVTPTSMIKTGYDIYELKIKCPFCKHHNTYKNFWAKNKNSFGFNTTCRNCYKCFFAVSLAQKIAYKHYPKIRTIRNYYRRIFKLNRGEYS